MTLGCAPGARWHELFVHSYVLGSSLLLGIGVHETCNTAVKRILDLLLYVSTQVYRPSTRARIQSASGSLRHEFDGIMVCCSRTCRDMEAVSTDRNISPQLHHGISKLPSTKTVTKFVDTCSASRLAHSEHRSINGLAHLQKHQWLPPPSSSPSAPQSPQATTARYVSI